MAKKQKQEEEIKTDLWKDTFSDLMNLLLCFFVLLYAMSDVDASKYAEVVSSFSSSFSIFQGGASSVGEGSMISSGAAQLNNLDEYYSDMGKAADSDEETESTEEYEEQKQEEQKEATEELYSEIAEKVEENNLQDSMEVTMDASYSYVMLSLSGSVLFESGSADIQPGAKKILNRVADILRSYSDRQIKIEGHTDNVPIHNAEFSSNRWLSTARATKVLEYMVEKKHLSEKHLEASGRGSVDPIASNATAAGRAKNRRVEIKIYSSSD